MSRTGAQLLSSFSRFIGDEYDPAGLSTSAAGDAGGTTLIDDTLGEFEDDALVGRWVRITQVGSNQFLVRRIVKNESVSGLVEVRPAFAAQIAASDTYELHRYDPRTKFTALDEARLRVIDVLGKTVYDDTTTADGESDVYPCPSAIRKGPYQVVEESPFPVETGWNFLASPLGDSTTGYTASNTTASTYDRTTADAIIPRSGQTATKLVTAASTAATYTLTIANAANSLTAAQAADRKMTLARMVYCTEASKVRLAIIDDSGTTYGSYHQGLGWELLTVEDTIAGNNTTLLSAQVAITSTTNASTIYIEEGWWYFGGAERVRDGVFSTMIPRTVRRDDTTQQVYLGWIPDRGNQLRFIGRDTLSALGTTAASQVTNTMEVDEENEQVLFAEAAKIMFTRLGLNVSDFSSVAQNIAVAENLKVRLTKVWAQDAPRQFQVRTVWR